MAGSSGSVERYRQYLLISGKSPSTADRYARVVDELIRFAGGGGVDRATAVRFIEHLRRDRGCGGSYLRVVGWAIRRYFEMLGEAEASRWIPVARPDRVEEADWLPETDILRIVSGDPVLTVAYDLALRIGEVQLLRRDRYNRETGEIEVYRLKHKGAPNAYILKLRPFARDALNRYLHARPIGGVRLFDVSAAALRKRFKVALARAGYDPSEYSFHLLRHSRLTNIAIEELRSKGHVDLVSLAKFAGHLNPATTIRYIHLAERYLSFGGR